MVTKLPHILRSLAVALALLGGASPVFAAGNAPQPNICTRGCWGARSAAVSTQMSALNRAVIHHTAGASDYNTTSHGTSITKVRAIQNLHMDVNGWSDIGYHFVTDKLGNNFEGRAGSMSGRPRGAHDGNNTNSFGFNIMGYYHTPYNNTPTLASRNSMYDLIAWKMPNGFNPYGQSAYGADSTCGYICGHRQVKSTSCPGDLLWAYIGDNNSTGEARHAVNARIVGGGPPPPPPGGTPNPNLAGWYRMTAKHSGKVVDVAGAGMGDQADVIQYQWTGNAAQVWHFQHLGGGEYTITAKHSGKALDVAWGSTADGANVWQFTPNGGNAQRWIVSDLGGGYHRIVAKHSGKVLDVGGASTANGADIIQYTWTGNDAQKFAIESIAVPVTNLSGDYRLIAKHSGKAVDVAGAGTADGSDVIQYRTNAGDAQVWNFQHQGSGYYKLAARHSGKVLDVEYGSTADGANVWTWTANNVNGGVAQKWLVEDLGDGHYRLTNQGSGKVLDVAGASTADGGNIIQYTWSGNAAQRFRIEQVGAPVTNLSGKYRVVSRNSGKVLDVAGGSTADGADVIQWDWTGNAAQIWNFEHQGNGFYALRCQISNKYLDLASPYYTAGTDVIQWTGNGGANQFWRVEQMPNNGGIRFVNNLSGLILDVAGASTANGGDVIQYDWNGHNAQRWDLISVP